MFGNDFMVPTIVRSLTILNCPSSQLLHPSGSMPFYYYFLEPSPSIPSSLYSSVPYVNQSHLQLPIHCLPYRIQDILKGKEAKATFSQSRYRSCFNNFILLLFLTSKFQSTSAYVIRLIKKQFDSWTCAITFTRYCRLQLPNNSFNYSNGLSRQNVLMPDRHLDFSNSFVYPIFRFLL